MQAIAQASAIVLAGASLGWIMLFSFVLSPVAFKQFDAEISGCLPGPPCPVQFPPGSDV